MSRKNQLNHLLATNRVTRKILPIFTRSTLTSFHWNDQVFLHRGTQPGFGVIEQIFTNKDYDTNKLARHQDILSFYESCSTPLIIDTGANIGASSVWFSSTFPRSKIIAIEPQKDNFDLLSKNTENKTNIKTIHGAMASQCGTIKLFDPGHGEWGYRTNQNGVNPIAEVDTSNLIPANSTPFILKMDIEGAEAEVFSKNTETFEEFPLIIIELHDWMLPKQKSSFAFLKWHCTQDRDFVYIGENIFSIANKCPQKITNNTTHPNRKYLHEESCDHHQNEKSPHSAPQKHGITFKTKLPGLHLGHR